MTWQLSSFAAVALFAAWSSLNVDIYTVDVRTGQLARLTASPGEDRDPSWSPDGSQLAFSSARDGTSNIYVMSADGGGVRRLTTDASPGGTPRWSPKGKAIAYVCDRDRARDLCVIDVDGRGVQRLTVGAHLTRDPPLWSPDGARIAFQIADDANYDIGVVRLSDGMRSLLASSPAYDGSYTWSLDGQRVAFISTRDGSDGMYFVDADGRHTVRVTATASLTPAWDSQR